MTYKHRAISVAICTLLFTAPLALAQQTDDGDGGAPLPATAPAGNDNGGTPTGPMAGKAADPTPAAPAPIIQEVDVESLPRAKPQPPAMDPSPAAQLEYRKLRAERFATFRQCTFSLGANYEEITKGCYRDSGGAMLEGTGHKIEWDLNAERIIQNKRMAGASGTRFLAYYNCLSNTDSPNRFYGESEVTIPAVRSNVSKFDTASKACITSANGNNCGDNCITEAQLYSDVSIDNQVATISDDCPANYYFDDNTKACTPGREPTRAVAAAEPPTAAPAAAPAPAPAPANRSYDKCDPLSFGYSPSGEDGSCWH